MLKSRYKVEKNLMKFVSDRTPFVVKSHSVPILKPKFTIIIVYMHLPTKIHREVWALSINIKTLDHLLEIIFRVLVKLIKEKQLKIMKQVFKTTV